MRLFFLLSFISFSAFAQIDVGDGSLGPCTEATFAVAAPLADNIYNCTTVDIDPSAPDPSVDFDINDLADPTQPLIIKATGAVSITANIDFRGQAGTPGTGGAGGPAAGAGGGYFITGNAGSPGGQGGNVPAAAGCGSALSEGSGGGGGSLVDSGSAGEGGVLLTGVGGSVTPGGTPGNTITLDINNLIVSGAGGASGEAGCNNGTPVDAGSGGGGGGSIQIIAAGDITVTGTIEVSGGDGEDIVDIGGGGGGGSGGIVILQTLGQLNLGTVNANEGQGGTNSTAPTTDGDGGDGAPGEIILQDIDGSVTGAFSPTPTISDVNGVATSSTPSLKSDITCGTIARKNDQNLFYQMGFGFVLVALMMMFSKTLFRFRMKIS